MIDIVTAALTTALADEGIVLADDQARSLAREMDAHIDEATLELMAFSDRRDHLATALADELSYRTWAVLDDATLDRIADALATAAWPGSAHS